MSIRIMAAIFENETLGPTERLIMLALADHADDSGRCYPSISRLCKRTGLSGRSVQGNLRKLQDAGYVSILVGVGQAGANVYFITATPAGNAPPRSICTPPLQEMHVPPAGDAPKPPITIIEPSIVLVAQDAPPKQPRLCRLPAGWVPNPRNISDAHSKQFTDEEIEDEAAKFRDHHAAKATKFADWDAGWRTWLGNARKFAPRGGMAGRATPGRHGQGGSIASIVARRRVESQI